MAHEDGTDLRLPERRRLLRELYHGSTRRALRFQARLLLLDLVFIAFFIVSPFVERNVWFYVADLMIASVLAIDLAARGWGWGNTRQWLARPLVWADLAVLASLLLEPFIAVNLAFLRVLRALTLLHSDKFWRIVGGGRWADTHVSDTAKAASNLVVFIFVSTGFVHAGFAARTPTINNYLDSLYFTITSLTTTGYGDIILPGAWGRIISILIMVGGVSLFVRLAQVLLRPNKVVHACHQCGLRRHEPDAIHCKACGASLNIPHDNE